MSDVRKRFGGVVALDGVDFEVHPGEVHALIGENGAGKSTLMKVLSGAHRPDGGQMSLGGRAYRPRGPEDARQQGVSMIYQELTLAPHLSVEQNVMLGREESVLTRLGVIRRGQTRELVRSALVRLGRSDIKLETLVSQLGPGDRQVVEITRALVGQARVVVLDEPTSSLGRNEITSLFDAIRRMRDDGVAVVYISHFLDEIQALCDRFTVLRDGRTVGGGEVQQTPANDMIEMMVGRTVDTLYPSAKRTPGPTVLDVSALQGRPRPRLASLELRRGEVLGIGGLVGAGRSELLRVLFGLNPIQSGQVRLAIGSSDSAPVELHGGPGKRLRQGIGYLSEDRKEEGLALRLPVAINATLSKLAKRKWLGRLGPISRRRIEKDTDVLRQRLAIQSTSAWQRVEQLSGGNQQKVALARLLHHDCDVLLLDEPTRGIDIGSKAEIYRLLNQITDRGVAVICVCSYIPELLGISDRVGVMHRGVLGSVRDAHEWTEHQILEEALVGPASEVC